MILMPTWIVWSTMCTWSLLRQNLAWNWVHVELSPNLSKYTQGLESESGQRDSHESEPKFLLCVVLIQNRMCVYDLPKIFKML